MTVLITAGIFVIRQCVQDVNGINGVMGEDPYSTSFLSDDTVQLFGTHAHVSRTADCQTGTPVKKLISAYQC